MTNLNKFRLNFSRSTNRDVAPLNHEVVFKIEWTTEVKQPAKENITRFIIVPF